MTTPFRVTNLTFNGGTSVDTSDADIVVIVGPNNTGKSRTLQEILQRMSLVQGQAFPANSSFVLDDIGVERSVTGEELRHWMKDRRYSWADPTDLQERVRTVNAGEWMLSQTAQHWDGQQTERLGPLAPHLVRGLWCGERLSYLGSPGRLDLGSHPEHPVHWLVREPKLMKAFSDAFRTAFGMNVIVDAWGSAYRLRLSPDQVQSDFTSSTSDGIPSEEIVTRMAALPLIEEQSDGVRSFSGILLTLLTAQFPLVLLDEPEAFLHPPQARLLGRYLSELQQEGQLVVATHSLDVLLGLIETKPEKVLILRLTRAAGTTFSQTLPPEQLAALWRDPLLRFSRALDGLFHDGVVVCEGDTDSQFYSAIGSSGEPGSLDAGRHIMFTYAGSKHRIPLITNALRVLDVPVRAIVDFDALNDKSVLRGLVEGVGGTYTEDLEADRALVDAHLRGKSPTLRSGPVLEAIQAILGNDSTRELTKTDIRDVRRELEPETGWRAAKRSGAAAVPAGDSTIALQRLLDALRQLGIFVVPCGEVESFVKAVGGKGPRWAVEVVEGGHLDTATAAQEFVAEVLGSLPGGRTT